MNNEIHHPFAKLIAAIGVYFTIDMLTTAGKVAGAILTICLLAEWVWKRILKPLLINTGLKKGKPRDFMESTVKGDL